VQDSVQLGKLQPLADRHACRDLQINIHSRRDRTFDNNIFVTHIPAAVQSFVLQVDGKCPKYAARTVAICRKRSPAIDIAAVWQYQVVDVKLQEAEYRGKFTAGHCGGKLQTELLAPAGSSGRVHVQPDVGSKTKADVKRVLQFHLDRRIDLQAETRQADTKVDRYLLGENRVRHGQVELDVRWIAHELYVVRR